jgi:hypothetical protein
MDKPTAAPATGAKQQIEKQARQLAYDTRYKVKQAMSAKSGARLDPAAVRKAYMSQLGKSSAAPAVKARAKQMLLGEDLIDARELANNSIVSALYTVFVEGVEKEVVIEENEYVQQLNEMEEKKYKIKVTDKKTGNTYVRMATREKIRELRANPNISSVEMTSYGEVSKSESESGSQTAAVKAGKDYDGDGKVESGAKEYRGAVHNAIQRKKGLKPDGQDTSSVKEEIIYEKENVKVKKITGEKVDNYRTKAVKVSPDMSEQVGTLGNEKEEKTSTKPSPEEMKNLEMKKKILQKKLMLQRQTMQLQKQGKLPLNYSEENQIEEKMNLATADIGDVVKDFRTSDAPQFKGKSKKKRHQMAIAAALTARRGGRKLGEEYSDENQNKNKKTKEIANDSREISTKMNLVKNKFRAMGLKMSYEPAGEVLDEEDPCWKGYTQVGMKKKNGKEVPNCVPSKGVPKAKGYKNEEIEVEGEMIDERRREDKGTPRGPEPSAAFKLVSKSMGAGRMGVQPRGQKKVPGKLPPKAGEYGAPESPAQKVAKRRAATQRAKELEQDTRGT